MQNKFDDFFQELISFHTETKLSQNSTNRGASENEIKEFELEINQKFGLGMKSYFKYFGNGRLSYRGLNMLSFKSIRFATKEIQQMTIFRNQEIIVLKSKTNRKFPINDVCFVSHIDYNGYFTVINPSEENPEFYGNEAYENVFNSHNMNLISTLRNEIFFYVRSICNTKRNSINNPDYKPTNSDQLEIAKRVDFTKFKWTDYYISEHRNITLNRLEFYKLIEEEEKRENKIVGHSDFEHRFIEFIENQKS